MNQACFELSKSPRQRPLKRPYNAKGFGFRVLLGNRNETLECIVYIKENPLAPAVGCKQAKERNHTMGSRLTISKVRFGLYVTVDYTDYTLTVKSV